MNNKADILLMIKNSVAKSSPNATVILYGSFARGSNKKNSDVDLLILLDTDKVSREDEKQVKYPLYEIEFETGQIISPLVISRNDWETRYKITPFYENVKREGVVL
ncbi:MAG: nucleotidyltransferase domain-containing protein [Bacteroidales bacterium]|nr:nucleotidyltransferase domain-containing protein [Bacteroidales bacterium]